MTSAVRHRREIQRTANYEVHMVGVPRPGLNDAYHAILRLRWWTAIGLIVVGYLLLNTMFAGVYVWTGGIGNARPGSFVDAFFFSVQTMGTIGYGTMSPTTSLANAVVVAESVAGLLVTALATGIVFVRFSQTRPRMMFSDRVAIAPMDGIPTLTIRIGNARRGRIVDAVFRLSLTRRVTTREGVTMYRTIDVPLMRNRATALSRSWTVLHQIEPGSPFHGESPDSMRDLDAELNLSVSGVDETSLQTVFASANWPHGQIVWGARLADIISEPDANTMFVDLTRFHHLVPAEPTEAFPYSSDGTSSSG